MEIGFHFVNFDVPGGVQALPATLAAAAQAAEQAGASWFTMADHFFQMDNLWPAESPMLEVYNGALTCSYTVELRGIEPRTEVVPGLVELEVAVPRLRPAVW
jgi:alkanesulfonate monooxygenase SsuD/methylene tetrahydromethanopterin reductase-like flavin-dependent oxidoreductase (luciferase family)